MDDYHLMQNIIQHISKFESSPYIAKLVKLLGSLQNFCTPLIQAKTRIGPQNKAATSALIPAGGVQGYQDADEGSSLNSVSYADPVFDSNLPVQSSSGTTPASAEDLMWQLFNTQVSMDWFDSDFIMNQGVDYS